MRQQSKHDGRAIGAHGFDDGDNVPLRTGDVASEGMLFVGTQVAEPDGTVKTTEFRVRVGS